MGSNEKQYDLELSRAEVEMLDWVLQQDLGTELAQDPSGQYSPAQVRLGLFDKVSKLRARARLEAGEPSADTTDASAGAESKE